ncbi:MAG: hypothetical protein QXJ69_01315 [Desulfurococcaceae archaeon]
MRRKNDVLNKLDEAMDLVEKIELFTSRMKPGEEVNQGVIYQIYESLVLLKEKILEARLIILQEQEKEN